MPKITFEFELVNHYPTEPMQVEDCGGGLYNIFGNNGMVNCIDITPKTNTTGQINNNVSENLLLKAIAVAQDPNLITRV